MGAGHRRWVACVALLAAASGACDSGDDEAAGPTTTAEPTSATTTAATEAAYEPVYVERACIEPVPDDPRVECGDLTVPADRSAPDEGDVVLPVVIIRSTSPTPQPDPLVHVTGGPGFPALTFAPYFLDADLGADRDFILFDQRGTGQSTPNLDCPEALASALENAAASDPPAEEDLRAAAAMSDCRDRLEAEGVDFDDYSTTATADDLDDLRRALGIEQWNLWGHSYGTMVVQEVLRRHPAGVRSAVLDGVLPLDVGTGSNRMASLARDALHHLWAGCAADPACAAAYPDLEADFRALVAEWDAEPLPVTATTPDGAEAEFLVTGADVVGGAFQAIYDTGLIPVLPSLVGTLRQRGDGATAIVRPLLEDAFDRDDRLHEAQTQAVNCVDGGRLDAAPDPAIGEAEPLVASFLTVDDREQCAGWGAPAPAAFNEAVTSSIPTLLLVGDYDPITPPRYAAQVAEGLSDSALVELPGLGHGTVFASDCAASLLQAFVASPVPDALDRSCVDDLGPPAWAT